MHWLTLREEDLLLQLLHESPMGCAHGDGCELDDDTCDALIARGLAREYPCELDPDWRHLAVTDTGRRILALKVEVVG